MRALLKAQAWGKMKWKKSQQKKKLTKKPGREKRKKEKDKNKNQCATVKQDGIDVCDFIVMGSKLTVGLLTNRHPS